MVFNDCDIYEPILLIGTCIVINDFAKEIKRLSEFIYINLEGKKTKRSVKGGSTLLVKNNNGCNPKL